MAPPTPETDALITRIISHMNADHQRSMALYLRHFSHLPATHPDVCASPLALTSIATSGMTIVATASGTTYTVPFEPALGSLSEARVRLVAMDADCRSALGLDAPSSSSVIITECPPPRGIEAVIWVLIFLLALSGTFLPWLRTDPTAGAVLDSAWVWAGGRDGYCWVVWLIRWPVLAVHVVEMVVFHYKRMQRHGVPTGSGLWWRWELRVLVTGVFAMRRLDRMVEQTARKEGKTL